MIEIIIDNGKIEDMHELSKMLVTLLEKLCQEDEKEYKMYEIRLYKMAFGNKLSKDMAEEIVSNMQPYGEHWDINESKRIQAQRGLDNIREIDFFTVLNSAYNDYNDIFGEDLEGYVRFTIDFINDPDAKEDKVFTYFTEIPM